MQFPPCGYRVSAKALILSEKGLLMVREHGDFWDLPGGGVEHFESPHRALHREVHEEVGTTIVWSGNNPLQAWELFDKEYEWPLLFLIYPATIYGPAHTVAASRRSRFFSYAELEVLAIEPYLEARRASLLQLAFPGQKPPTLSSNHRSFS
jgi:8-oxo-dGTP pyrophosphatase MutT (NUDIX family)